MGAIYQIQLKSIKVIENGTIESEKGCNGFIATLYYPNANKTALVTTRKIALLDNTDFDFTHEKYVDQILFKEEIINEAYLEIEITSIKEATKLSKFFYKLFKVIALEATTFIPWGSIVTAATKFTTASVFEQIEPSDKIEIIGKIGWLLSENMGNCDLPLHLAVPKEISLRKVNFNESNKETVITTKVIHKDYVNAHVVLTLKKLT